MFVRIKLYIFGANLYMNTTIVIQQMIIIFALILIGFILHRTKLLTDATSKQISGIILKVCNPALLISSALEGDSTFSIKELGFGLSLFAIMYIVLILLSLILPVLLRIEKNRRYAYTMMTIFGNVGFIGIPLATEVLGTDSLVYVSICNLFFSIIIYTFGISVIEKAAREQGVLNSGINETAQNKHSIKLPGWINIGTAAALITIIIYLTGLSFPMLITSTLSYAGRCTTFLSMLVLGVSVSTMNPKKVFTNVKLYIFILIRLILIPVIMIIAFKQFTQDSLLINSLTIMLAISFANMPLMFAKSYGVNDEDISGGIILSTIISLVTIPIVSMMI